MNIKHNHITRDIKPLGQCPACDDYHDKHIPKSLNVQLEQWINDSAYRRAIRQSSTGLKSLDEALQWHIRVGYEDGANEMKELLLIAVDALEGISKAKCSGADVYSFADAAKFDAIETLKEIQEKIKR